jgi:AraC-like DNA-binding protein
MSAPKRLVVPADRPTLAAWVTPREHSVLVARVADRVTLVPSRDVAAIREAFATGRAHGAIVSAALLDPAYTIQLAQLHRAFPHLPLVGLVTQDAEEPVVSRAGALGRLGAESVADLRMGQGGWAPFNKALDRMPTPVVLRATALVQEALGTDVTEGWLRFIAAAFLGDAVMVRDIALQGGAHPSAFTGRFYRAKLPSPRRYIEMGFIARFAYLAETTSWSVHAIARSIEASSPQSLGRMIKRLTGLSPVQWRLENGLASVLADFSTRLIKAHLRALRHFDPFQGARRCSASS